MKLLKISMVTLLGLMIVSSTAFAGDFDWVRDFNIRAEANPKGFRARIEARFKIGDMEIEAILDNVEKPSDAYILLRLGEMSNYPIDYIQKKHNAEKRKGWGVFAKSLGIKPGSKDFHALKQDEDLYSDRNKGKYKNKNKGKGKKRK